MSYFHISGVLTLVENKLDGIVRRGKVIPEEKEQQKPPKLTPRTPPHIQRALSVEDYVAAQVHSLDFQTNNQIVTERKYK